MSTPVFFYGVPEGCSFGTIVALEWSGLPYRLCRIEMPSQVSSDAYFMGIARWNDYHRVLDRRDYPNVHRLHERLQADPAVRFAHAIEHGDEAQGAGGFQGHVALHQAVAALR
jgi:hypothetical protein